MLVSTSESNGTQRALRTVTSSDERIERIQARALASKTPDECGKLPAKNKRFGAERNTSIVRCEEVAELIGVCEAVIIND